MSEYKYTVILHPLPEGGYNVVVPAIPEICTFGETLAEAREMAHDAIACHVQGLLKDGEEIPEDPFTSESPVIEELRIAI